MRKKDLLKELKINEQTDISGGALDIDTENIRRKVHVKLDFADQERKQITMRSKKKLIPLLIAATLAIGATVFAATGTISSWIGESSSRPDYRSLPTETQVKKDIGYEAVLIDTFKNGYQFKDGNIVKNRLQDENKNVVEKFRSVSFTYEKDKDEVIFSQEKFNSEIEESGKHIATVDGTNVYYTHYTNKTVPADYKMTEKDKEAEASGKLVFSYGSSKVEKIQEIQSITWEKDGVQYQLMQIDGQLSSGELLDMAKEVIGRTEM